MWKTFQQLAFPSRLYRFCCTFIPWLAVAGLSLLATGLIWGFVYAPESALQGARYRIIYLNVPATIASMGIYCAMIIAAVITLVRKTPMATLAVAAMAPVGAIFSMIALMTEVAWGNPHGHSGWGWGSCLASELVLLMLYSGIAALWHACRDHHQAGVATAILVLAGGASLPFIHVALHRETKGVLHGFEPAMHSPLELAIWGFLLLFATLTMMRLRNLILMAEKHRPWVSELVLKRG